ncbi:MAG: PAS domain S-box protein [Bacteroidales bacterium]|nr:PAS domain S-box protein [Bacteroidales bacterium]
MSNKQNLLRILFAENNRSDVILARKILEHQGVAYTDDIAENKMEFMSKLNAFEPDLVISNSFIPGMDGYNLIKKVRDNNCYLPVIFLTDSTSEEQAANLIKEGAGDYILKENIEKLPGAVREAIETSQSRKDIVNRQDRLYETVEEYRELINGMNETVWMIHTDGHVMDVNNTAVEMLGYSREELIEKGLHGIDKYLSGDIIKDKIREMQEGQTQLFNTWHISEEGREIPVEISSSFIRYHGEKVVLCVARDLTERIKAEDNIRLLSRSVEQSPASIIITDSDGKIEYVNPVFSKITGYTAEELKGHTPRFFKSGKQTKAFYEDLWNTILSGKEWYGEMINKKKNGEFYWEDLSISPIFNKNNKITHFVSVREDITEKKKMIEDLQLAKQKAEESDRLKSAFLANVSHEIRTPMNGILGFTDILREPGVTKEEYDKYIEIIFKSGQRLMNTVNDIVEISKIEAGIVNVDYVEFNVNNVIRDIVNNCRPDAERKGLSMKTDKLLPEAKTFIKTDREKVESIINNLVNNAVKYTTTGEINVGCFIEDAQIEFYVRDTGEGVPEDRKHAIFNRFEQADISDSHAFEGSGLGLSISKSYVDMLGGDIWVESEESNGSVFCFRIPLHQTEKSTETIAEKKHTKIEDAKTTDKRRKLKTIIAEDDETSYFYLATLLKDINSEIVHCKTGSETVDFCRNNPDVDLILMDIKMPDLDGYQATRKIREFDKDVYIIAQTAYTGLSERDKAIQAGCDEYISKPIKKSELLKLIKVSIY